jgi:hypothetical protein
VPVSLAKNPGPLPMRRPRFFKVSMLRHALAMN